IRLICVYVCSSAAKNLSLSNPTQPVAIALLERVAILPLVNELVAVSRTIAVIGLTEVMQIFRPADAVMTEIVRAGGHAIPITNVGRYVASAPVAFYVHVIVAISSPTPALEGTE